MIRGVGGPWQKLFIGKPPDVRMSSPSRASPAPQQAAFRSWGETQIGRMLDCHGIRYFHEHPLAVIDRGRPRIWYPDFQLPGYGVVLEYCGRVHDPSYAEGMVHKKLVYEENGISALLYTPDLFRGDWPGRILSGVEKVLTDRVACFRDTGRRCKNQDRLTS